MYYIRLSKKQMQVVADALDLHSRVLCGDLGEAIDVYASVSFPDYDHEYVNEHMEAVCKEVTRLSLGASVGIFSKHTPEDAKIAYEIYKAIKNTFYFEQPEPRPYSVHDRVVNDLTKQPIVKIQKTFEVLRKRLKRNGKF